tara:strand:+ start:4552 stop:5463 length:912 start_codon:yes stop_codon:yes gene_type:complete
MLKVFYNENQATTAETSFSPSAKKPKVLVEQWLEQKQSIEVVSDFDPVTVEQFCAVHEKRHVEGILDCLKNNGFGNKLRSIAETLPWTSGSFLAAAKYALENKTIAMSPTSGFHHATHDRSMGFCTFNGLMVTAVELLKTVDKVGILDLDHHYGNGTDTIIEWLVKKEELDDNRIHHYTVGGDIRFNYHDGMWGGRQSFSWKKGSGARWVLSLPEILSDFAGCDIVLFQAGADPHCDDPCHEMLGVFGALTTEQLIERDRVVFETLRGMDIPIAWNLAGGYQEPLQKVLDIHHNTLAECLKVL